jgi:hypothetical protein
MCDSKTDSRALTEHGSHSDEDEKEDIMFQAQARWLLAAGVAGSLLLACSDDSTPQPNNTAGTPSGGSAGSAAQGGSSSGSGGSGTNTAGSMSSSGSGGMSSAGAGGTAAGSGGAAGGSGGSGGSGGASGGSGGGGGSGGAAGPTAVANIMGVGTGAGKVTGTATFTQGATMTTLVLNLTACPDGVHSSHLHLMKDCGDNGNAAGGHWTPNGEMLGDYTCADGKVTKEVMKGTDKWTVGDGGANDVTKYSFMVHAMGDAAGSGDRIGCGLIEKK